MVCFRCDGKGQYRNEFGLMEKCESCQKKDMNFKKINAEPDSNEEGLWEKCLMQSMCDLLLISFDGLIALFHSCSLNTCSD